jgi:hypothetical protein
MTDISKCVWNQAVRGWVCDKYVEQEYSQNRYKGTYPVWNVRPGTNIGFESVSALQDWLFQNYGADATIAVFQNGNRVVEEISKPGEEKGFGFVAVFVLIILYLLFGKR